MRKRPIAIMTLIAAGMFVTARSVRANEETTASRPDTEISFGLGGFEPQGSGDLWQVNEDVFTQDPQDFDGVVAMFRIGTAINNYLVVDVGASWFSEEVSSSYQFYTDTSGNRIEHDARLRLLPVTVDLRVMPFGRYASAGDGQGLRTVVPWLAVGGGAMLWEYCEHGEFVDTRSLTIFNGDFSSRGISPEYHGAAGVDVNFNSNLGLFVEVRFSQAEDDLSSDFEGFGDFDLSGASISTGLRLRF